MQKEAAEPRIGKMPVRGQLNRIESRVIDKNAGERRHPSARADIHERAKPSPLSFVYTYNLNPRRRRVPRLMRYEIRVESAISLFRFRI